MPTCASAFGMFIVAFACAILGNVLGMIAWRGRRPDLGPWDWITNPTAFWRSRNFTNPQQPVRIVALAILLLGAALLTVLALLLMRLQRAGVTEICGFAF